jgi:hypothetical protein
MPKDLPLPGQTPDAEEHNLQARVDKELFDAAKKEAKKNKVKIREVIEWGLRSYLVKTNPKAAGQLGINEK